MLILNCHMLPYLFIVCLFFLFFDIFIFFLSILKRPPCMFHPLFFLSILNHSVFVNSIFSLHIFNPFYLYLQFFLFSTFDSSFCVINSSFVHSQLFLVLSLQIFFLHTFSSSTSVSSTLSFLYCIFLIHFFNTFHPSLWPSSVFPFVYRLVFLIAGVIRGHF